MYDFDCCVCDRPLPEDHSDWHTDEATGGDCHPECCSSCGVAVHEDQAVFDFDAAKPHPDPVLLAEAMRPRRTA